MAKRISWSAKAQADRKQILKYWEVRNGSKEYSKKRNQQFKEAVQLISRFPGIGKQTDDQNARIKIVRAYFIINEETITAIHILAI
ncbi:MAG: type II toxin-antitoxin system RelE/ParE family toxin [Bacteroidota bacterium]|nr:type II toxin-antitoxin system RelE/ParE family toxin [Bacteroidota bacterium]